MSLTDRRSGTRQPAAAPPTVPGPRPSGDNESSDAAARTFRARATPILNRVWASQVLGVAVALSATAAWALAAGWWTPRGPLTTNQALTTMAVSLLAGAVAGVAMRSRWALLLTPVVFAAVFEVVRVGSVGPSVDGLHLSTYGVIAFATGRLFHALLAIVPLMLGASIGAAAARRLAAEPLHRSGWASARLMGRRVVTVLVTVALFALAVGLARPASTEPITGADGDPLPGSIAELIRVDINGHDLSMMIRGGSTDNPVLLFLAGGPGGTELGAMRNHGRALEKDFVVVTWDQRGTGRSYDQLEPTSTLTLDNAVSDTIAVTDYLRTRFAQDKIFLLGQSWGTFLGVLAAQSRPELFRAFIGTGQMVSPTGTDRVFYADTLAWAKRTGDTGLAKILTDNGPPPYNNTLAYEPALSFEQEVYPYDHSVNAEGSGQMSEGIFVGEYALIDQVHNLGAFIDSFAVLYPQIQGIDFRTDATRLDVPVYLFQGAHEAPGRADLAEEWFEGLDAPRKQMTIADTSGHRPLFEQPEAFQEFMVGTVLPGTG